ncbi:CpaF family protein [Desulfotruncus alcoholivorax]|uniref:CpaF family protein n=1 Tax=Desulfotruncus alcoholivorax TaxID=265477 RepID=UPI00040BD2EC|nr:CpaF family protein [Desulfotruncus alcoholivorax]
MDEFKDLRIIINRSKESGNTVLAVGHLGNSDVSEIKARVKTMVYNDMDKSLLGNLHLPEVQQKVKDYIKNAVLTEGERLSRIMRPKLLDVADEIIDEVIGLGPIQDLIDDPDITEIMVNGPDAVYVERNGLLELTDIKFDNNKQVLNIIDRIVSRIGRKIDESTPMVDARLPDGSRVNAIIPPLSLIGPVLTIRKFSKEPYTPFDLVFRFNSFSCREAYLFQQAVERRLNIMVSGGTGSGKTTLLNVLSSFIPATERIITVEDSAELQLQQPHVLPLESRPPNVEGKGQVTIRDLVKNCLRMRPDRIVVGEVRSGEALDMLQAMNTGHDGSLTTGHANSSRDILSRLETMVLQGGIDLPVRAIRQQIASAIDLIIHQERFRDEGKRRVTEVVVVAGIDGVDIITKNVLTYDREKDCLVLDEHDKGYEILAEKLRKRGVKLPDWVWGGLPCRLQ